MRVRLNGQVREVPPSQTIQELLQTLKLAPETVLVEQNEKPVRRPDYLHTLLAEGDSIEIVRVSAGG